MAEEYNKNRYEENVAVETKDRGLFDFMGKKKEEEIKYPQEEVIATEFEKVHVSEPEQKVEEYKVEEDEEKKHGLLEKLHRSNSSSSSSSDEEQEREGEETKKKKKKGLKQKEEEKFEEHYEDTTPIPVKIEKYDEAVYTEPAQPEEKKEHYEDTTSIPVKIEKYDETVYTEPAQPEEKKHFLDKIKEKLPGQNKKTEEVPPTSPISECAAAESHCHEVEPKEKKGILEKIKEKLPGYHSKTEEEKEKEKECASH